ncbi:recombinase family protein [Chakrabartyella piscis]|uniref:recombinase family protein n=1 Tax=Chakrabartyella piscis TaxID=2918914 RepID=UPI00295881D6|nr:recombinase family protein [Chakrabartyella piscis]
MDKVAIYCRISVEDGLEESASIQNQRELLRTYAKEKNWDVVAVYIDENYSGLGEDRPAFVEMIAAAKKGDFSIILCKSQSRFSRNWETVERYFHRYFPLWGIRFVSIVDGTDTQNRSNKKARQINGLINEWYSEELSDNIRMVLRRKMEMGQFIGNYAPYGYEKSKLDQHKLIIIPEEAKVVVEMANWYVLGDSFRTIADQLNAKKIPTPSETKRKKGQDLGRPVCLQWKAGTVGKILKNPVYLGHMVQGKEEKISFKSKIRKEVPKERWVVVRNTHEPILTEEVFAQIEERRKR